MKTLSLTQPWATLVTISAKTIETRSWPTRYRGPLAIHAAKGFPPEARAVCEREPFRSVLARAGYQSWTELPTGVVLATCTLGHCLPTSNRRDETLPWVDRLGELERAFGDYSAGRFGWHLSDVRPLPEPVPARGALGLWEWDGMPDAPALTLF